MSTGLESVLANAGLGVSPREFLTFVEDAVRKLAPPRPDPAAHLSVGEREALAEVGLDLSHRGETEIDHRARAVAQQAVLHDSALTVPQAAAALGIDTSRVRHRIAEGRLAGWKDQRGWRLPAWQFTTHGVLPGLDVVLASVPADQPALVVAAFMSTVQEDLQVGPANAAPRDWLLAGGDPARVARLAARLGEPV
ncbi:hypothetical protein FHR81_000664 [Actinoalloteichus hoggarensis]|uniref:helix-turn-helix domain-containing protein n=1 Tax=Actinoalloteichus hoggarensis TaxID=1470176 RepID=UPI000B8A7876|nr:helix-turn-helix domain-containing protein [Actinoalloteichus hoggarensis]MBB5919635.1 hypothetical protein [Actinoalloteichus hoggarensis]